MSISRLLCTAALVLICGQAAGQDASPLAQLSTPSDQAQRLLGEVPTFDGPLIEQIEQALEEGPRRGGDPETVHVVLDFAGPPDGAAIEELRALEVQILGKVADGVWAARIDPRAAERLAETEIVREARIYPVAAKISPLFTPDRVGGDDLDDRAGTLAEGAEVSVTFFEGVSEERAREALSAIGVEPTGEDDRSFEITQTLLVPLPERGLLPLALLDEVQVIEPPAPPLIPFNQATAQVLSNVDDIQAAPFDLDGAGVTLGIWEAQGVVRATHQGLTPRVTVQPNQTGTQTGHANHVAGTMVASGVNTPAAEGMAPVATLLSWDANGHLGELGAAAAAGASPRISVSNHSYGFRIGWDPRTNTWTPNQNAFGAYTAGQSAAIDTVIAGNATGTLPATELVSVWAAGNDRDDAPIAGIAGGPQDCLQGGLTAPDGAPFAADCLGGLGVAKNTITVGAMNGAGAIAWFSSYGPTDDGRVKPDLVAQGVNMLSLGDATGAQTNTGTHLNRGTSMATPVVSGIAALMTQEFDARVLSPLAATYKAILIQTARDVAGIGQSLPGPDFATGWGIADAEAALNLIRRAGGPGYAEGTVASTGAGNAWTFPFVVQSGTPELRLTLAWSDLPSNAGGGLVNDLDLRLLPPDSGAPERPFAPNAATPWVAAARGDNTADNVEQVLVRSPAAGTWTAQVTAKPGSLVAGPQRFAIAGPITPDAGPIVGPKADIVMVLDKSGSMRLPSSTAGLTKMESMQSAARATIDYLELVGGHGLSVVAFDAAVAPTTPAVGLEPLDVTQGDAARQAVGSLTPSGNTGIIAGVAEAVSHLASPAAINAQGTVVLFSDGRHNSPRGSDVGAIDAIMDDDTRFFSIGFGTDVDSRVMPGIAANHAGVHLEEQGLAAGQLSKLFMVVGGLAAGEEIVVDPDYTIEPDRIARQDLIAAPEDRSITFAAFWDERDRPMDFLVVGPNARCKVTDGNHEGYAARSGDRHRIIRIDLPYRCDGGRADGEAMHQGPWQLQVRNRGRDTAHVKVMALADTTVRLHADVDVVGREAVITARMDAAGEPVAKGLRIRAEVMPNRPSTGDSLEQDGGDERGPGIGGGTVLIPGPGSVVIGNAPGPTVEASPPAVLLDPRVLREVQEGIVRHDGRLRLPEDVLERLLRDIERGQVSRFRPAGPIEIELRDDGQGADTRAGDGLFTARVRATAPVLHGLRLVAELARPEGILTREHLTSFLIR